MIIPATEHNIYFKKNITISNINFSYNSTKMVLDNINIEIPKGYKVGLVGETASGKSTLADILALLLDPIKGNIIVDGITLDKFNRKSWQRKISYVSQSIFLNDSTIKENIAFGEEHSQINMDKVVEAATLSQLKSSIGSFPNGYDTIIGETGVKLLTP